METSDQITSTDKTPTYTVSEIARTIRELVQGTFGQQPIWVQGEVWDFRGAHHSGHMYFSLKDQDAILPSAFFRNANRTLNFKLQNGQRVRVLGTITTYPAHGKYQLIVQKIQQEGQGDLFVKFEALKKKLKDEGLFDSSLKRQLPSYPKCIGIVTSPTGAVIRDLCRVMNERYPSIKVILHPSRVQGEGAAEQLCAGIDRLNETHYGCDMIIVARGGGSLEDLWAFNEEALARKIRASRLPIISAVGHETDFTIADFVADVRAATPSHAAEICVPNTHQLLERLTSQLHQVGNRLREIHRFAHQRLNAATQHPLMRSPMNLLGMRAQRVDQANERLLNSIERIQVRTSSRLTPLKEKLDALSPFKVLGRGYSIALGEDGKVIRDQADAEVGSTLNVQLATGELQTKVEAKKESNRWKRSS